MARFDDLKERLKSGSQQIWERVRESSAYHQMKDRFENLTPGRQKLVISAAAAILFLILISLPMSYFLSGSDSVSTYEAQRDLIHDLFKIKQDAQDATGLNPAPAADRLRAMIDSQLQQAQLLPEQILGTSLNEMPPNLPKDHLDSALQISLRKLNLRQIIDIGYSITSLNSAIKMVGLSMEANSEDSRYFDVIYKIITLKVPVMPPLPPLEDENKGKGKSAPKPKGKSFGSDE